MFISKASFEQNQRIQISYLGYETKELELSITDNSIELEVRLVQSDMILHEVVAHEEPSNFRTYGGAPLIHLEDGKPKFRHRLWWRILHPFHRCGNGE